MRRLGAATALLAAALLSTPAPTSAQPDDQPEPADDVAPPGLPTSPNADDEDVERTPEVGGGIDGDDVVAGVGTSGDDVDPGTPGVDFRTPEPTAGPACSPWVPVTPLELPGELVPTRTDPDGRILTWHTRTCEPDEVQYRWIPTGVDPDVVIINAVDQARRRVRPPTPDINPAPDVGSYVNLGLWLAVRDADPIVVTAAVGDVSATATAALVTTTFTMGDGTSPIECDGPGVPIDPTAPEFDDVAPDRAATPTFGPHPTTSPINSRSPPPGT